MLGFAPLADTTIAGFGNTFVSVLVTGVAGTSAVGEVSVDAAIQVTGFSATSAVGSVTTTGTAFISPTGVVGTSAVGQVFQWDQIIPSQTPSWTNIAA
tara:strand:+ start:652 stop:945 length:294 start_codon:yes stop_codon:yes gene_type:complete